MAEVSLEATIQAEAHSESRLGRAFGLSVAIKDADGPSPFINAGSRWPKPLKIDESRFSVAPLPEGSEG